MKKIVFLFVTLLTITSMLIGCSQASPQITEENPETESETESEGVEEPETDEVDVNDLPVELQDGLRFPVIIEPPEEITTYGPDGTVANWYTELYLTPEEVAQIRSMNLRAGFELINSSEWDAANLTGFKEAAELLNIEIAAEANCDLDPIKQKANMEQFAGLDLDIVTGQPQDLDIASEWFDPLVEQGVQLVFMSNVPTGYEPGVDYVGAITDDLIGMGIDSAEMIADAIGGEGQVISIEVAGVSYVTNTRDKAFRDTLEANFPDIEVVEIGGFQSPDEAGNVASALLTKYPDVKGIYVSYSTPAISVLEAIKSLGRDDVKIITMDLDTTVSLDMAQGGNVAGISVDLPYLMGFGRAMIAAYGILGKECPGQCYFTSPAFKATRENLAEAYLTSFGEPAPQEVLEALGQ